MLDSAAIFGAGIYWNDPAFRDAAGAIDRSATETVILELAANNLPMIGGILLLIGAAAIIFSTANTFLMVPSTNVARDIYQRFINPDASEQKIVLFQRIMIVVLAAVAFMVTSQFENILDMALYAYTMVGAAVTPALLAAFLWKRVTPAGGTASVALGIIATMVFAALARSGMESFLGIPLDYDYIIYPAGTLSILALIVVSLLTKPSEESKWKPFWPNESD